MEQGGGLGPLLSQLLSPDNAARSQAEAQYNQLLETSAADLTMELLRVVATLRSEQERPLR